MIDKSEIERLSAMPPQQAMEESARLARETSGDDERLQLYHVYSDAIKRDGGVMRMRGILV